MIGLLSVMSSSTDNNIIIMNNVNNVNNIVNDIINNMIIIYVTYMMSWTS